MDRSTEKRTMALAALAFQGDLEACAELVSSFDEEEAKAVCLGLVEAMILGISEPGTSAQVAFAQENPDLVVDAMRRDLLDD